ncbi:DUF4145 domain-containing protein [Agrobacterium cavarae]|uniref:DUF4145 domain-containing protein n=1 Tax=Agrobacterium cavarae TaxID=2528239 RepID=UPI0028963229|nr:DUF4145 domain-containing protein [Agrobacterium cavarae]
MSILTADCPRCGAKNMSFDLKEQTLAGVVNDWQRILEVFCVCRGCSQSTVFRVRQRNSQSSVVIERGLCDFVGAVNKFVAIERYISIRDNSIQPPPEHLPENIKRIFEEGAACMAVGCYNAAATMFRLCLDLATKAMLPEEAEGLNNSIKRNLGLRLPWLFNNGLLPAALSDLSSCIKDDGNDGAHEGLLTKEDSADILDFTFILLERLYTEPKRIEIAAQRRAARRDRG